MEIKKYLYLIFAIPFFCVPFLSHAENEYGPNVITGGTVTCDSEYDNSTYACVNSIGDNGNFWHPTNTSPPHWWKYDLGSGNEKTLNKFYIKIRNDGTGSQLKDFTIKASNDNWSTETNLGEAQAINTTTGYQTFVFENYDAFRYYSLDAMGLTWNPQPNLIGLFDVQGMECTNCVEPTPTSTTPTSTDTIFDYFARDFIAGIFIALMFYLIIWLISRIVRKM